jgi:hypothetical protein
MKRVEDGGVLRTTIDAKKAADIPFDAGRLSSGLCQELKRLPSSGEW